LRRRRCAICGIVFYRGISKACGTVQYLMPFFHCGEYSHVISASVITAICDMNRSLLVNAINIATLRAAKLRSYWKRVFFVITSTILSLRSAPQENRYWNSNFRCVLVTGFTVLKILLHLVVGCIFFFYIS
jgi:hypothetical protein